MKEIFSLLSQKERRILVGLCVLVLCGFIFYSFAVSIIKGSYSRSLDTLSSQEKNLQILQEKRLETKINRSKWEEAVRDMVEIEQEYFYSKDEKIQRIMLDTQELLRKSSLRADRKRYEYTEFKEEGIERITVSFEISGPYIILKKFLDNVEDFPKFLTIEQIDFVDIDSQSGRLTLQVKLAGYYGR